MITYINKMKKIDIIFSLVCGWLVGWLVCSFSNDYGFNIGLWAWFLPPILAVFAFFCLFIADFIGKKILFVYQLAKHILVGIFATVIDLKTFELFVWIFSISFAIVNPIIFKGVSFLVSTSVKYFLNKNWTFIKPEKDGLAWEICKFITVVVIGLGIDVSVFYYFTKILGPQFGASEEIWARSSVILAAIITAIWNFTGEKFIVFKK